MNDIVPADGRLFAKRHLPPITYEHSLRVARRVGARLGSPSAPSGPGSAPLVTVALLHDVVEDGDVALEDVRGAFGDRVADAVGRLTRRPEEPYDDYIGRVMMNPDAVAVKVCDLEDHLASPETAPSASYLRRCERALGRLRSSMGPRAERPRGVCWRRRRMDGVGDPEPGAPGKDGLCDLCHLRDFCPDSRWTDSDGPSSSATLRLTAPEVLEGVPEAVRASLDGLSETMAAVARFDDGGKAFLERTRAFRETLVPSVKKALVTRNRLAAMGVSAQELSSVDTSLLALSDDVSDSAVKLLAALRDEAADAVLVEAECDAALFSDLERGDRGIGDGIGKDDGHDA